jgi:serine/threonine protein phosphatase 1
MQDHSQVPITPARSSALAKFALNAEGRDFVVGDIHGMFSHLRMLLDEVGFDPARDRLFSVGDLVDRGPESHEALDWLDLHWFHAVRGNHEQFAIESEDPEQLEIWLKYNGGGWWVDLPPGSHEVFRRRFLDLPLVMEIETRAGLVGIVHADVPPFVTWDSFVEQLASGDRDAAFYAMWSRNRIQGNFVSAEVQGRVIRVYCGHTPIRDVIEFGNVHFIDTGAVYCQEGYAEARLTLIEIQPELHRVYAINTNRAI